MVEAGVKPPGARGHTSRGGLRLGRPRGRSAKGAFFEAEWIGAAAASRVWWKRTCAPEDGSAPPFVHFCTGGGCGAAPVLAAAPCAVWG